ncbi:hypothetical protein L1049_005209 [Liquidambar formosana]|uniref:Uncharacterized protein n=1 Tax=Liquidambar formosana TaxID=63359 RepID=A0AAP0X1C6_LIQFO
MDMHLHHHHHQHHHPLCPISVGPGDEKYSFSPSPSASPPFSPPLSSQTSAENIPLLQLSSPNSTVPLTFSLDRRREPDKLDSQSCCLKDFMPQKKHRIAITIPLKSEPSKHKVKKVMQIRWNGSFKDAAVAVLFSLNQRKDTADFPKVIADISQQILEFQIMLTPKGCHIASMFACHE